ncbi:hypothetical protein LSM04_001399 [Trypanosoma melophagium]|uniref:uncharacterized protein n=1 Tax=Trypanosoma melophagium TaxID=715481 RepID=UPI00351A7ACB|nr:hypothetical protein LSM04_001399 [Trypanosoma melophagium]
MNLIPYYRSILKGIHAAKHCPHHLQDIRFILSYPPVENIIKSTCNTQDVCKNSSEEKEPHKQEKVDSNYIVRICCEDLRRAFLPDSCISSTNELISPILSPAAQRFIHLRELLWIKERLEDIARNNKEMGLVGGIHAENGNVEKCVDSENDVIGFLGDEVFLNEDLQSGEKEKHLRKEKDKNEDCDILAFHEDILPDNTVTNDDNDNDNTDKDFNLLDRNINSLYRGIPTIGDLYGRGEPVLAMHSTSFHLTKHYLNSFGLNLHAITEVITSTERLTQFLQEQIPRTVTCRNENITLTATVRPFDTALGKCSVKGVDPFELARRTFVLEFSLKPENPSHIVDMVDAYLLRLDVRSSQLIEEFSRKDSSRLFWMMNERCVEKDHSRSTGSDPKEDVESKDSDVSKIFELTISNPSNNPTIMKGQLYYVLRTEEDDEIGLHKLPIFSISFGHLLFSNEY